MDIHEVKTEEDLKRYLDQQHRRLNELEAELDEKRAESATRRLELAEAKIQRLSEQGLDYGDAFEQVISELEEEEFKAQTRAEQAQRERVARELEEMSDEEQRLLLELEDKGDDN